MTCPSRPRQTHITLPQLSGEEASLLVAILERAIRSVWRAHGDSMIEFLRTRPNLDVPAQSILHSLAAPRRPRREPWSPVSMPDEIELYAHPELASLALLEAALCASTSALKSIYPELCDVDQPDWTPSTKGVRRASAVILSTHRLLNTLYRYRNEVDAWAIAQEASLPF